MASRDVLGRQAAGQDDAAARARSSRAIDQSIVCPVPPRLHGIVRVERAPSRAGTRAASRAPSRRARATALIARPVEVRVALGVSSPCSCTASSPTSSAIAADLVRRLIDEHADARDERRQRGDDRRAALRRRSTRGLPGQNTKPIARRAQRRPPAARPRGVVMPQIFTRIMAAVTRHAAPRQRRRPDRRCA